MLHVQYEVSKFPADDWLWAWKRTATDGIWAPVNQVLFSHTRYASSRPATSESRFARSVRELEEPPIVWKHICQWKDLWLQRLFILYSLSWGLFLQERIHAKAVNAHLCTLLILALKEIFLYWYDEALSIYTWYDATYEWTYSTLTLFWALWLLWGLARLYQLQPWKDTAWRISGTFVHFWFFKPLHLINSNPTTASTCRFGSGLTVLWRDHWKFQWKIDHVTEMKEHSTWIPESPLGPRIVIQKCCCNVLKYHRWRCCVGGPEAVHPCVFARVLRWNCLLAEIFTQDSSTLQLSGQKLDEWAGTPTVSGKLLMDKILQLGWIQKIACNSRHICCRNSAGFCAAVGCCVCLTWILRDEL